jgi:hypothetical protein
MNNNKRSPQFIWLVNLCIFATFLNASSLLQAAAANEIQRPQFAEGKLSVTVNEDSEGTNAEYQSYIITFKNLDDYELSYQDLAIKFPELQTEPELLSAAEAERLIKPDDVDNAAVGRRSTPVIYNHYYYPHSYYSHSHYHGHHSSGLGHCKDACAVIGIILIVVAVVGVVGLIANAGKKKNKVSAKNENSSLAAEDQNQDPKAPIRLLRFQEKMRKITVRKDDIRGLKTISIELVDKNDQKRVFQANLPGRAAI